jgi:phosphorylcholine metabolism protein LicD
MIKYPKLTDKNLVRARKVLFDVLDFCDSQNIDYYLEGGTLLGLVRDGELLPWDHDIDLSISVNDVEKFVANKKLLAKKGYRLTSRKIHEDIGGFKKGQYRVFKVKKRIPSILKAVLPIFHKYMVVADIFVKADDETHTYWQAMEKIMRVDKIYYSKYETIKYLGQRIKVPYKYKDYLTEKYGDWSFPIKEWNCARDESTVIRDAV